VVYPTRNQVIVIMDPYQQGIDPVRTAGGKREDVIYAHRGLRSHVKAWYILVYSLNERLELGRAFGADEFTWEDISSLYTLIQALDTLPWLV